jgi:hypothetical protein
VRTDGQTDMMRLILAFRNFAKTPDILIVHNLHRCWALNMGVYMNLSLAEKLRMILHGNCITLFAQRCLKRNCFIRILLVG